LSGSIDVTNKSHPVRTYWTIRIEAYLDQNYTQLYDYVETTVHVLYVSIPDDPYKYKCDYDGSTEEYCPTPDGYNTDTKIYGTASAKFERSVEKYICESGEAPVDVGKDVYVVLYLKGDDSGPTYLVDRNTGIKLSNETDTNWRLLALKLTPYQKDTSLVVKFAIDISTYISGRVCYVDAIRIYEF